MIPQIRLSHHVVLKAHVPQARAVSSWKAGRSDEHAAPLPPFDSSARQLFGQSTGNAGSGRVPEAMELTPYSAVEWVIFWIHRHRLLQLACGSYLAGPSSS